MNEPLKEFEQDSSEVLTYGFDFDSECVRVRNSDEPYALNSTVRPVKRNGFQYRATTAGRTGTSEPRWPETIGGTVRDGSVVWTCEAVSAASLERSINGTPVWIADSGVTVGSIVVSGEKVFAPLSGGQIGQDYLVRCLATLTDNNVVAQALLLKIRRPARVVSSV